MENFTICGLNTLDSDSALEETTLNRHRSPIKVVSVNGKLGIWNFKYVVIILYPPSTGDMVARMRIVNATSETYLYALTV